MRSKIPEHVDIVLKQAQVDADRVVVKDVSVTNSLILRTGPV